MSWELTYVLEQDDARISGGLQMGKCVILSAEEKPQLNPGSDA